MLQDLGDGTVLCSISTFSGGGIGDAGVEWGAGVPVLSACELVPDRAGLIRQNYPHTTLFKDLRMDKGKIVKHFKKLTKKKFGEDNMKPWLFVMSPPCQGMSSNGAGRIRASIKAGKRPKEDERNRLILPGVEIIEELRPSWFILENVRRMENTVIRNEKDEPENILSLLARRLNPLGYTIRSAIVDFRDLGVPHHRQRLITIGTNVPEIVADVHPSDDIFSSIPTILHPPSSHGGQNQPKHISLRDVIGNMPELDALTKTQDEDDPLHNIPKWNEDHHFWMKHTPEGKSAFENNKCVYCDLDVSHDKTLVSCPECKEDLPRPTVQFEGWKCKDCGEEIRKSKTKCTCGNEYHGGAFSLRRRIIRGFKTSYRRLKWEESASTITMNSNLQRHERSSRGNRFFL